MAKRIRLQDKKSRDKKSVTLKTNKVDLQIISETSEKTKSDRATTKALDGLMTIKKEVVRNLIDDLNTLKRLLKKTGTKTSFSQHYSETDSWKQTFRKTPSRNDIDESIRDTLLGPEPKPTPKPGGRRRAGGKRNRRLR